jgi:DNA mismatch repair protein MutS
MIINDEIKAILDNKDQLLTQTYFQLQEYFEKKYGQNTFVMMEIGTFFEVYEVNNDKLQIGKAKEISELLNIQLTRKNKNILENSYSNPLLTGIPAVSFDKYIRQILKEEKYTIVIVRQKGTPPNISRYIDTIISPSINIDYQSKVDATYTTALTIDINNGIYSIAYASMDVATGKTHIFETHSSKEDKYFALDEVFNLMQQYPSNEVLLSYKDKSISHPEIVQYFEFNRKNVSYIVTNDRLKTSYQNEIFKIIYNINSMLSPIEFMHLERYPMMSEVLALLLDFIAQHDSTVLQNIKLPIILDSKMYMFMGNDPLSQLNIFSEDNQQDIFSLICKTTTTIGKRMLKTRLSNPIMNQKELQRRYDLSIKLENQYQEIDNNLKNIYDLERILRRIDIEKLHPYEIKYLYDSIISVKNIIATIPIDVDIDMEQLNSFISFLEQTFFFDIANKYNFADIQDSIFMENIDINLDLLINKNKKLYKKLEIITDEINSLVAKNANSKDKGNIPKFATIEELDKEGHFISITKNRFSLISDDFEKAHIFIDDKPYFFKQFRIRIYTNSVKITSDLIDNISDEIIKNRLKIISLTKELFVEKMKFIHKKFSFLLEEVIYFIADVDISITNIKNTIKYNLTQPIIVDTQKDENFLEAINIRHLLIEQNQEIGIYVPNSIVMGDKKYIKEDGANTTMAEFNKEQLLGALIYGINSSGKSSLMKSLGICVILAQSGLFVPSSSFRFSLFDSLFTRIVSKDNLSKGLSLFAVEMIELKSIFNRASKKSLVLADEISHGTETISALSIVASSILKLCDIEALFVFATHLHQLIDIKEVTDLKTLAIMHLSVEYDEKQDKLLFDRNLKKGSGSSIYGLEFVKSLHMDKDFINYATNIRKHITGDYSNIELLKKKKTSKYNKNLYVTKCIICDKNVDDIHHIQEQNISNKDGFIGHFHKNHKYNLLPLCKKHHKDVHSGKIIINGFVMSDKGLQLHFEEKK